MRRADGLRAELVVAGLVLDAIERVLPRVAEPGVVRDPVQGHALGNRAVLAHDEVRRDEVAVRFPPVDGVRRGRVALGIVQDDVLLTVGGLRAMVEVFVAALKDAGAGVASAGSSAAPLTSSACAWLSPASGTASAARSSTTPLDPSGAGPLPASTAGAAHPPSASAKDSDDPIEIRVLTFNRSPPVDVEP